MRSIILRRALVVLAFPAAAWGQAPAAPSLSLVGAAFDEARGRLVIVGGGDSTKPAETWESSGGVWRQARGSGPSARDEPLLAYDRARKQVVLFGGYRGATLMNDTWTWDGEQWRRVATDGPQPRSAGAMVYDSKRSRILLFGGSTGAMGSPLLNDLWEWDGARWRQIAANGAAESPPARALHALAYDEARDRLVLAGGFHFENGGPRPLGDTWEWNGARWSRVDVPGPGARDHLAMVYDPERRAIVMHGGGRPDVGLVGDTWTFDGRAWTKLLDDGPPRGRHRLVYDTGAKSVVLYGGWGPKVMMTETWRLGSNTWELDRERK